MSLSPIFWARPSRRFFDSFQTEFRLPNWPSSSGTWRAAQSSHDQGSLVHRCDLCHLMVAPTSVPDPHRHFQLVSSKCIPIPTGTSTTHHSEVFFLFWIGNREAWRIGESPFVVRRTRISNHCFWSEPIRKGFKYWLPLHLIQNASLSKALFVVGGI